MERSSAVRFKTRSRRFGVDHVLFHGGKKTILWIASSKVISCSRDDFSKTSNRVVANRIGPRLRSNDVLVIIELS